MYPTVQKVTAAFFPQLWSPPPILYPTHVPSVWGMELGFIPIFLGRYAHSAQIHYPLFDTCGDILTQTNQPPGKKSKVRKAACRASVRENTPRIQGCLGCIAHLVLLLGDAPGERDSCDTPRLRAQHPHPLPPARPVAQKHRHLHVCLSVDCLATPPPG